ncbi:MAG: stage III sporulation protein AB [Christensenellaceae bacterium]|jgi:stage III sporulation protein AB|nr:stage III sporulation protein AB [Christensenellaceae bacterium]
MQLRLGLALCGAALFAAAGFYSARRMRKRLEGVEAVGEAIRFLRTEISAFDTALPEALRRLRGENRLLALSFELGGGADEAALQRAGRALGLKRGDLAPLSALLRAIPHGARGETRHFDAALQDLEAIRLKAAETSSRDGPLHQKLGLLVGAAAFILLL